jgi:hypothetical protein
MHRNAVPPNMSLFRAWLLICCTTLVACNKPSILKPDPDLARINSILAKRKAIEQSVAKPTYKDFTLDEMTAMITVPIYAHRVSTNDHHMPTRDMPWSVAMQTRTIKLDTILRPDGHRMPEFSAPNANASASVGPFSNEQTGAYYQAESVVHCIQDPATKKWLAIGFQRDHCLLGSRAGDTRTAVSNFPTKGHQRTPRSTFSNPEDIDWAFGVKDYTKIKPFSRQSSITKM